MKKITLSLIAITILSGCNVTLQERSQEEIDQSIRNISNALQGLSNASGGSAPRPMAHSSPRMQTSCRWYGKNFVCQ